VEDSIQIGPGKTLDSSVDSDSAIDLLTILRETSLAMAKKKVSRYIESSNQFIAKLGDDALGVVVRDFRRGGLLLHFPRLEG